jgi:hypothetical protein
VRYSQIQARPAANGEFSQARKRIRSPAGEFEPGQCKGAGRGALQNVDRRDDECTGFGLLRGRLDLDAAHVIERPTRRVRDGSIDPGLDEDRWPRRCFGVCIEIGDFSGVSSYPVIEPPAGLVSGPIAIERRNVG